MGGIQGLRVLGDSYSVGDEHFERRHCLVDTMSDDRYMPIPDFQTLMGPLLEEVASHGDRPIADVRAELARRFELTDEEVVERLPSGLAKTFDNRVGWAATYLYRCRLLERPRRSVYRITDRGRDVLAAHPDRIDLSVLSQFHEFEEFRSSTGRRRRAVAPIPPPEAVATPEERVEVHTRSFARPLSLTFASASQACRGPHSRSLFLTFSRRWATETKARAHVSGRAEVEATAAATG